MYRPNPAWLALFLAAVMTTTGQGQNVPDGTIILSHKNSVVGRVARRITGGDKYTHAAIVFNQMVYESDFPRAMATPLASYGKRRGTYDLYTPTVSMNTTAMHQTAQAKLGTPYRLRRYFNPNARRRGGTWCSEYVGDVMRSGGWQLSQYDSHEPSNLLRRVGQHFRFSHRIQR